MVRRKALFLAWMTAALALFFTVQSAAQQLPDQRTFFTFSAPVTLPGVTLPAGKYEFKLANTSDRHVVQVFDDNGRIKATLLAIAAGRSDVPNDPEIRFMETPSNMAPAIRAWWYPGVRTGHEFLYPKSQAMLLAKTNTSGVLTGGKSGEISRVMASGAETKVSSRDEVESASSRSERNDIASASTAPMGSLTENGLPDAAHPHSPLPPGFATRRTALPHTAGSLGVVLVIGIGALGLGVSSLTLGRRPRGSAL